MFRAVLSEALLLLGKRLGGARRLSSVNRSPARLILSSAALTAAGAGDATADRYEVRLTTAGTQILRCSAGETCPAPLVASDTVFVSSYSPSTASPISSVVALPPMS